MNRSGLGMTGLLAASMMFMVGSANAAGHMFVGATKCAICHKTEAQGEQYPKWQASKHAQAYATLATPAAKDIGKKLGIEDPQDEKCLGCHVTGHGADAAMLGPKYDPTEGVTCESCHGAGGDYSKKSTMEGIMSKTIEAASVGLTMPDEKTCVQCHNDKSPSFTGFDFDKMKAKIAHPMPAERKAKYQAPGK
jgi:Cytochrome c554 and c-prime